MEPTQTQPSEQPIEDVNASAGRYFHQHDLKYVYLAAAIELALVAAVIFYDWSPYLLILPIFGIIVVYGRERDQIEQKFFEQEAQAFGMSYSPTGDLRTVTGKLFKAGHSQSIRHVLTGSMNGRATRIFQFSFTIGYGKSSRTIVSTVFETVFNNDMPDIILRGTKSVFGLIEIALGEEKVTLEGDFNAYFSLRVPKGFEADAYEILTPDIMADLIDKAKDISFEFCGNRLYIYTNGAEMNRTKLQQAIDFAGYLENLFSRSSQAVDVASEQPQPAAG
ncbi:MAG: hypothetical protein KGI66_02815 [Patescibacteria group bacterium]|nr:hypothetical protein [Patescibacteria group bacterium]